MKNRNVALIFIGATLVIVVIAFIGRIMMDRSKLTDDAAGRPTQVSQVINDTSPGAPATGGQISTDASSLPYSTVLTQSDGGKTVTLKVGSRFLLKLGTDKWDVNVGDTDIVHKVSSIEVGPGAQGVYEVLKAGTTTLTAEGRPNCKTGELCAQYIINFKARINAVK